MQASVIRALAVAAGLCAAAAQAAPPPPLPNAPPHLCPYIAREFELDLPAGRVITQGEYGPVRLVGTVERMTEVYMVKMLFGGLGPTVPVALVCHARVKVIGGAEIAGTLLVQRGVPMRWIPDAGE